MPALDLREYLSARKALVDEGLDERLPSRDVEPCAVHDAMRYATLAGGKRLRPILSLAVSELGGQVPTSVLDAACGIELLHTGSLVIDDLPSMDDAQTRRETDCTHVRFGEATALLAALGLVALAFDLVTRNAETMGAPEAGLRAVRELAAVMGTDGIVGGQHIDLHLRAHPDTPVLLESMFEKKAAALFLASLRIPAILIGLPESDLDALTRYGRCLGLAFQITDDLLDSQAAPGDGNEATHAAHLGVAGARARVNELTRAAVAAVDPLGDRAEPLRVIAEHVSARTI